MEKIAERIEELEEELKKLNEYYAKLIDNQEKAKMKAQQIVGAITELKKLSALNNTKVMMNDPN